MIFLVFSIYFSPVFLINSENVFVRFLPVLSKRSAFSVILLVLPMFLDVVKAQRQNLQNDFIQDFHPVLFVTFVTHRKCFCLSFSFYWVTISKRVSSRADCSASHLDVNSCSMVGEMRIQPLLCSGLEPR